MLGATIDMQEDGMGGGDGLEVHAREVGGRVGFYGGLDWYIERELEKKVNIEDLNIEIMDDHNSQANELKLEMNSLLYLDRIKSNYSGKVKYILNCLFLSCDFCFILVLLYSYNALI